MRHINIFASVALLLACVCCLPSCGKKGAPKGEIATIYADASFENIINDEIGVFEYIYGKPGTSIIPFYVDEKTAIDSLLGGATRGIVVSRQLNAKEAKYVKENFKAPLREQMIAVDAIAIIVNPQNPITSLTINDLNDILTGKYTSWGDIEPSPLKDIVVVFDHQGSSTVKFMRDSVMHGQDFGSNVGAQGSPEKVLDYVANNRGAIGFIGVNWLSADLKGIDAPNDNIYFAQKAESVQRSDTVMMKTSFANDDVRVVPIQRNDDPRAWLPYQEQIYDGSYPLFRHVYMITIAANGTLTHQFYSFVTSPQGQKLILASGIMPATANMRQHAEVSRRE